MPELLILTSLQGSSEAERILDTFEQQTGLAPERREAERVYELDDGDHRVKVVERLTAIDAQWTDHVGLRDPA